MPPTNALTQKILETVREQLIPWAQSGAPLVLMGAPPIVMGNNAVAEHEGSILPLQHGYDKRVRIQSWPEENLNAMAVPYIGCVVDGEADIVTGTTETMTPDQREGKRWVIQGAQRTFFIAPPSIPISRGSRPHWERPHPELAFSRILWMQFQRTGVRCHFCVSENGNHWSQPFHFVYGVEFLPLSQKIIQEIRGQASQHMPLAYHYLGVLLHLIVRELSIKNTSSPQEISAKREFGAQVVDEILLRQVTDYIDQNIHQYKLCVPDIAEHCQISTRHLSRIFKHKTNQSIKEYIMERRVELAKQLLIDSAYTVKRVSDYCGYASPSSFIQLFRRYTGMSPVEFRQAKNRQMA